MMKVIAKVICLFLISSNLFAQFGFRSSRVVMPDFNKIKEQYVLYNNVYDALSVVEVLGSGKGSGILILLDEKVVVVTNSHNLQGREFAQITLPDRKESGFWGEEFGSNAGVLGFKGKGVVLYDFPLSDVAILSFPEQELDSEQLKFIRKYALANGVMSIKKGWKPSESGSLSRASVSAVLNGKNTVIDGVEGYGGGIQIKDTYISGDESMIWAVPVYSKPGMSGGAFYRDGILEGLVTKISLGGFPVTLATPMKKIADLIQSPPQIERQISWKNGLMVYTSKDKLVTVNPLGNGWLGNGGELLNVVDESETGNSNPNYWKLEYHKSGYGKGVITTWDPFVFRPGNFVIGQENISFIKTKSRRLFRSTESYMVPTLAKYIASEKNKTQIIAYPNTAESFNLLKDLRLKAQTNITNARVYQYDKKEKFFKVKTNSGLDEVLATPKTAIRRDREGFINTFSSIWTKPQESHLFNIKVEADWISSRRRLSIQGRKDLSAVVIRFTNESYDSSETLGEVVLTPEEFNSPQSIVFKSEDGKYKAIFMYANDDLTSMAHVYIISDDMLVELWGAPLK